MADGRRRPHPLDLRHLFLPAITLGSALAAYDARLTRTALLDELHRDYVRTARAVLFATLCIVVLNLIVDLLVMVIDPQIVAGRAIR